MNHEFYVGYVARMPRAITAFIRRRVLLLLLLSAVLALFLAASQQPSAEAVFEYGSPRTFRGVIREAPVPSIHLASGNSALLVAPGKHGASTLVSGLDGRMADLRGTRIERDGIRMIEILPGSIHAEGVARSAPPPWTRTGPIELTGEIVDSKCYLGVMKPGEGYLHRACAIRCISGGVPPALLAFDAHGARRLFVLTGRDGLPVNRHLLDYVGRPVKVLGELLRSGERLRLEIDPLRIQPLE